MGQERLSITVENPTNAFWLTPKDIEELVQSPTKKQLDEIFKKSEEAAEKANDSKQIPVPHEILTKPFEIVK